MLQLCFYSFVVSRSQHECVKPNKLQWTQALDLLRLDLLRNLAANAVISSNDEFDIFLYTACQYVLNDAGTWYIIAVYLYMCV